MTLHHSHTLDHHAISSSQIKKSHKEKWFTCCVLLHTAGRQNIAFQISNAKKQLCDSITCISYKAIVFHVAGHFLASFSSSSSSFLCSLRKLAAASKNSL